MFLVEKIEKNIFYMLLKTIIQPFEVWDDGKKIKFIGLFKIGKGEFVRTLVLVDKETNEIITMFPIPFEQINKNRIGRLIYE